VSELLVRELARVLGYRGYEIKRAKWRQPKKCGYCGREVTDGCRVYMYRSGGYSYTYACSWEHGLKLLARELGEELAEDLSGPYDPNDVVHEKLIGILRMLHNNVSFDSEVIYSMPESGLPEVIIKNFYPYSVRITIDYIEVNQRDFIDSLLREVARILLGADVELLLDLRHTPREQILEAKKMVRELYCRYIEYGFKPVDYVECGGGDG